MIFLGFWLLATPETFGFSSGLGDHIAGVILIGLGWLSRSGKYPWAPWAVTVVGIWLQFAPLVFWAKEPALYLNDTLIGVLAIAFSIVIPLSNDEEPTIPPGWTYNPSSWAQRLPIALLALLCWFISRYLSAVQLGYIAHPWDPFFGNGTETVLTSAVSHAFPVSDAGLGALAYTLEFLSTCQGGKARWRTAPWIVLIFGILVIPVSLVSVVLIILQPLAVGAWCTLCLITAVLMLLGIPLALDEVIASIHYLRRSKKKPFLALLFEGGADEGAAVDRHLIDLDHSLFAMCKESMKGVTLHWSLLVTALVGIFLMTLPNLFPIFGALSIVLAVIAASDFAKKVRYLGLLIALLSSLVWFFLK